LAVPQADAQKNKLLQRLDLHVRDDDFFPKTHETLDAQTKWKWRANGEPASACVQACSVVSPCCAGDYVDTQFDDEIAAGRTQGEEDDEEDLEAGLFVAEQPALSLANEQRIERRRRRDLVAWRKTEHPQANDLNVGPGVLPDLFKAPRLPDPLSHLHARPMRWDDHYDDMLKTYFQQPVVPSERLPTSKFVTGQTNSVDNSIVNLIDRRHFLLTVELQQLVFDCHEHFEEEDHYGAKLLKLYDQWQYGKQQHAAASLLARVVPLQDVIAQVDKKLTKVRHKLANEKRDIDKEPEDTIMALLTEKRRLCRELRTVRQAIRDEESGENRIVSDIAACWMKVKEARRKTKLKRTDLQLRMRKQTFDAHSEEERFQQRLEAEAGEEEMLFEVEQDYKLHKCDKEIEQKQLEINEEKAKHAVSGGKYAREKNNKLSGFASTDEVPHETGAGATGAATVMVLEEELDVQQRRHENLKQKRQRGLNGELLREKIHKQIAPCRKQKVSMVVDGRPSAEAVTAELIPVLTLGGKERQIGAVMASSLKAAIELDGCTDEIRRAEEDRRHRLANYSVHAKMVVNGHHVGTSRSVVCSPDFLVDFDIQFGLQLVSWPESVVVEIYKERSLLGFDELLGSMFVMIPGAYGVSRMGSVASLYRFQAEAAVTPSWVAVQGAHSQATGIISESQTEYYPSGSFQLMAKWGAKDMKQGTGAEHMAAEEDDADGDGMPDIPPRPQYIEGDREVEERIRIGGFKSEEIMERMAAMDPNDPSNTHLDGQGGGANALLHSPGRSNEIMFRLHPEDHAINCFGPTDASKRHKLAIKRWATHRHSQLYLHEHQIHEDLIKEDGYEDPAQEDLASGPRDKIKMFIEIVQKRSAARRSAARRAYSVADVVREPVAVEWGTTDFSFLTPIFAPSRKLKPSREEISPATSAAGEVEVMVIVMRGFDFPVRADGKPQEENVFEESADASMTSVEVRFQNGRNATRPVGGADPQWNETLFMKLETDNRRYVPKDLEQVTDVIHINVFDELTEQIQFNDPGAGGNQPGAVANQERPRNYLGSIQIPFQHVYMNGKVEGVYEVETLIPPVHI